MDHVLARSDPQGEHQGAMFKVTSEHFSKQLESAAYCKRLIELDKTGDFITKQEARNWLTK